MVLSDLSCPHVDVPDAIKLKMDKDMLNHVSSTMTTSSKSSTIASRDTESCEYLADEKYRTINTLYRVQNVQRKVSTRHRVKHYRLVSTVSFVVVALANWVIAAFTIKQGLIDGGRAGLIWSFVWTIVGFVPVILSLAEMASIYPVSRAQYHWVTEFAPENLKRPMAYLAGWSSTLAWQAGNARGFLLTGSLLQTLIIVNDATYISHAWQGTLLTIAVITSVSSIVAMTSKHIPCLQNGLFLIHLLLYTCVCIPIWVLSDKIEPREAFLSFQNHGGWKCTPLALLIGQLSAVGPMTGIETATHMAEEIKDASRNLPIAIIAAYLLTSALSISIVGTIVFAMPDVSPAIDDPTGLPLVYIMKQILSQSWVSVLICGLVLVSIFSNMTYHMATARELSAFSRDRENTFPLWNLGRDEKRHTSPLSIMFSGLVAGLLSLSNIGNTTAFYTISSLFVLATLQCYMFSIGTILWRRLTAAQTLSHGRWSLGRWGVPMNILALVYVSYAFFWSCWPQSYPVDLTSFNWAPVIFSAVIAICAVLYPTSCKAKIGSMAG